MDSIKLIGTIVFSVAVLFYEKVVRVARCQEKIKVHISRLGGAVTSIEKLSSREEIYSVGYLKDGEWHVATVNFGFFYREEWYLVSYDGCTTFNKGA